jgi:hypothetical protein
VRPCDIFDEQQGGGSTIWLYINIHTYHIISFEASTVAAAAVAAVRVVMRVPEEAAHLSKGWLVLKGRTNAGVLVRRFVAVVLLLPRERHCCTERKARLRRRRREWWWTSIICCCCFCLALGVVWTVCFYIVDGDMWYVNNIEHE